MKNTPYAILDFIKPQQNGPGEVKNNTIPRDLKLTHLPRPCEDCGDDVVDRRTIMRYHNWPCSHWRIKCENCKLYRNPATGEFDCTRYAVDAHYKELTKQQKNINQDK